MTRRHVITWHRKALLHTRSSTLFQMRSDIFLWYFVVLRLGRLIVNVFMPADDTEVGSGAAA